MTWFIIRTATRQEQRAMASLIEAQFSCYLPTETRWRRTPKVKEKASYPLLAGYLMVDCEPTECSDILKLDGVHQFVRYMRSDGEPAPMPIPVAEVMKLKARQDAGEFDLTRPSARERKRLEARAKAMKRGAAVLLTDGPFAGFIGKVIEMRASDRAALVGVEAFGRVIPVELSSDQLDAA
jgi:transcription antitermination factor NusG